MIGDDKEASEKQSPQEKEDELHSLLGGSDKKHEPAGPQGKDEDAFAGLFDESAGPRLKTANEKDLIGDWFGEGTADTSSEAPAAGDSDDLDKLFDVAGDTPHEMDIDDVFPE